MNLGVLAFSLHYPGLERARRQVRYLTARPESVLVLTGTGSRGCDLVADEFRAAGCDVVFPRPPAGGERGTMIVSRLATRPGPVSVSYLPHRVSSVTVDTTAGPVDIVAVQVPSRDSTRKKTERKAEFLDACRAAVPDGGDGLRIVMGDLKVLEPDHHPWYPDFRPFEYGFYRFFGQHSYVDAHRAMHPDTVVHSKVGRAGDGYRYDHAHISARLAASLRACEYDHQVRTGADRLSDRSALSLRLALHPVAPLPVPVTGPAAAVR
ncbi:endonuclease/exonuclease/phosphatase [Streptomyces albus]